MSTVGRVEFNEGPRATAALTGAVPRAAPPSYTVTVLPPSAVPDRLIVLVVSTPRLLGVKDVMTGGVGGPGGGGGGELPAGATDTSSKCHSDGCCMKSNSIGVLVLVAVNV